MTDIAAVRQLAKCMSHPKAAETVRLLKDRPDGVEWIARAVLKLSWQPPAADAVFVWRPEWWATPLGQLVAAAFTESDTATLTMDETVAVLGVTRQRVYQIAAEHGRHISAEGIPRGWVASLLRERGRR